MLLEQSCLWDSRCPSDRKEHHHLDHWSLPTYLDQWNSLLFQKYINWTSLEIQVSHPINWLTLTMAEIQRVTLTGFARAAVPSCPRSRSHKHVFNDTSSNWKTKEIKTSKYWSHHGRDGENTSERCWKKFSFCGSRWAKWFQAAKCSRPEFYVERFVHFWQFIKYLVRNQFNP